MMKKHLWLLLALSLLLSACGKQPQEPDQPDTPDTPPIQIQTPEETPPSGEKEELILLDRLTVELVVDWEDSDRILSQLEELSRLLSRALAGQDCQVEDVTVTISTAGGFTAEALAEGGVDVAFLPAVDYVASEAGGQAVLTADEAFCTTVAAVTKARPELDEAFCGALERAVLETDEGGSFLEIYRPGLVLVPASQEALDGVRAWLEEQEKLEEHG